MPTFVLTIKMRYRRGAAIGEPDVLCVYLVYATRVIIIKILTR